MGMRAKGAVPALKKSVRGRGYVNVNGKKRDLGKHGTPACDLAYADFCAEWAKANQLSQTYSAPPSPTVGELYAEFSIYAAARYRRDDGTPTDEAKAFDRSLAPFLKRYRGIRAAVVGQEELETARADMVAAGLSRRVVNQRVGRIRRFFRWGVSRRKVDAVVVTRLESVRDLEAGYSGLDDPAPVRPVPIEIVELTIPHLNRWHAAMVRLQLATGARPGEVCRIRGADVSREGVARLKDHEVRLPGVWVWQPAWHKNKRRQKILIYVLGPKAIALLRPWLRDDPDAPLFQPREAMREYHAARKAAATFHNRSARVASPRKQPGLTYTTSSYDHAIARACEAAGVPAWSAHKLRKLVSTQTDRAEGIESSRKRLGHANIATTELYVERDLKESARLAEKYG